MHDAGLEDEPEDTVPAQQERQMRYDDEGLDSEDDFIDDDIGDGVQGQRPRRARSKIRTDGVHSQAVQVMQPLIWGTNAADSATGVQQSSPSLQKSGCCQCASCRQTS